LAAAVARLRHGDLAAADAMCRRLLADAPSDPALHQLAAAIARQRGDHQLARRWVGPFHPDRTARPLLPLISSLTPMMAITRRAMGC